MIRKRLSLQLVLVLLTVSLVPLVGVGVVTLHLVEQSIEQQVRTSQEQVGAAASAMVRDFIERGTTKLKSIAHMIKPGEDPSLQTKRLNSLLDPPDIFLEVSHWNRTPGPRPNLYAQVQQSRYVLSQSLEPAGNRAYNSQLGQFARLGVKSDPLFSEPYMGNTFVNPRLNGTATSCRFRSRSPPAARESSRPILISLPSPNS